MARIDLATLSTAGAGHRNELARYKALLMVCTGTNCVAAKAFSVRDGLKAELGQRNLQDDYLVIGTGCHGFCAQGPILVVQPEGILYQKLDAKNLVRVVEEHLAGGRPVEDLMYKDLASGAPIARLADIPFFSKQLLIALRNRGFVDPEEIDSALARGAYESLAKALAKMRPDDVRAEVLRSGLRGRGGGGFPTGLKWNSCVRAAEKTGRVPVLVCNGNEGIVDRSIVETDPHAVLEGMALGAYAIGAGEGHVYIRKEYSLAMRRLERAIAQAREHGLLGKGILGTDFAFDIKIHRGAGAWVCGESSALMASLEGLVGEPRTKYIHHVEAGYKGRPTVLNNVETWANVPVIVDKGGAWFGAIGTGDVSQDPWGGSSGTKVFSLMGNVRNTGLVEAPMGIRLREIVFDYGGGIPGGRTFKAVQTGGPSGGCLPAALLDEPVDYESLKKAGSIMGSGALIVMDDRTCMVDVAKYFIDLLKEESCGKCTPCREGCIALSEILGAISRGAGNEAMLDELDWICGTMAGSSLCQLGATSPNPVLSTLRYFRDEYIAHIRDRRCPAGVCKALIRFEITDACTGCHLCAKSCPTGAVSGDPKGPHAIDQALCIQCGVCRDVCKFDAVKVE